MKPVYYLINDNSVEWFTYIIAMDGNNIEEMLSLDRAISGEFLTNIFSREMHFSNKEIRGETYYGWTISKNEFDKLKEIISLYPSYKKYLELCYSK
jgi:protein-tyrosine-phosphatase